MMDHSLVVEQSVIIHASKPKIWKVLTDPSLIKEYLFGTETITNWKVGDDISFQGEWQGQAYKDKGRIREFTPEKILSYDYWSAFSGLEDVPENYSIVTYTLADANEGVKLSILQKGFGNKDNQNHSEKNWSEVLSKIKEISESL